MTCECGSSAVHETWSTRLSSGVVRTHFHCESCSADWFEETDGYAWPPDEDQVVMT